MRISSRIVVAGVMVFTQVMAFLVAALVSRVSVDHALHTLTVLAFVFGMPPLGFAVAVRMRSEAKRASPVPTLLVIFVSILFVGVDAGFDGGVSLVLLGMGLAIAVFGAAFVGTFGRSGGTRPAVGER